VGRARGARNGDAGCEAGAGAESENPAAHPFLPAEKVGHSFEVEEQAIGCGDGGPRSPASSGEEGEAGEDSGVGAWIGILYVEAGDERPRLGDRHSRLEPERLRFRRSGGDLDPVPNPVGEEEG
jgi:hypothetical protein